MTDNRDIDKRLAARVMGWDFPDGVAPWIDKRDWRPSSNIEDAWDVVGRMAELGFYAGVQSFFLKGGWRAGFHPAEFNIPSATTTSQLCDTAPMAICLAALDAIAIIERK